ncbi:MAG TPA: sigma-70 family RNA polymerase sigma factor [Tepidisphaeraceae bacterium]|nr:sigma-70 family RNA polymerase sigma factor [Tepidisphaeraceae bacterium]
MPTPSAIPRSSNGKPPANVAALIDKACAGDEAALGELLGSYYKYLSLLARVQIGHRLQRKVDGEDIVQETFLEAHRQIAKFRGRSEGEFLSWLRRILAGRIALTLRHYLGVKGRDVNLECELVGLDKSSQTLAGDFAASCSSPSQRMSRREQAVLLADALAKLPESYRETIILRNLEGLSFSEVAARMERSEDAVQKLWVRGLSALRNVLGEQQ